MDYKKIAALLRELADQFDPPAETYTPQTVPTVDELTDVLNEASKRHGRSVIKDLLPKKVREMNDQERLETLQAVVRLDQ